MDVFAIKTHMLKNNMNITKMANALGVSPATYSRWLRTCDMPISKAEEISIILGIPNCDRSCIFFT